MEYERISDKFGNIDLGINVERLHLLMSLKYNDWLYFNDISNDEIYTDIEAKLIPILDISEEIKDYFYIDLLLNEIVSDSNLNDIFEILIDNDIYGNYYNKIMMFLFSFKDVSKHTFKKREIYYINDKYSNKLHEIFNENEINKIKQLKLITWKKLMKLIMKYT